MAHTSSPVPRDAGVARLVEQLDANRREAFEERAGILEFEARLPRLEAERQALIQTLARYGLLASSRACLLQVEIAGATQWLLTGDEDLARQRLAEHGVTVVADVDLVETLRRQYGELAVLAIFP